MAREAVHAGQRVANNRGAQVTDVHLLGDVGRRVVDDHGARHRRGRDAEPLVGPQRRQLAAQERGVEREVEESRSGHLDRGDAP